MLRMRGEGEQTLGFMEEISRKKMKLERERREFGFGANCENSVFKMQQRSGPTRIKHVYKKSGRKINPLGRFRIRPSGWIQRAKLNTVTESSLRLRLEFCKGSGWMDF